MGEHENPQPPSFMGSTQFRLWLYSVFIAVSGAIGVIGLLDGSKLSAINLIISAVLGVAAGNVPHQEK